MGDVTLRSRFVAPACALLFLALGCGDKPPPGPGAFGEACEKNTDCKSLICAGLEDEQKICSVGCSDPLGDECDFGFRCRRPEDLDQLACVCTRPAGCDVGRPMPGGECDSAADCDDGIDCTDDVCDGEECSHLVTPQLCGVGESCLPDQGGCVEGEACTSDSDCPPPSEPCIASAFCDFSAGGRCVYGGIDNDFDGHAPTQCGGDDCDDGNGSIYRGAFEACDMTDNDCDGSFDESAFDDCGGDACFAGTCECAFPLTDCSFAGSGTCVDLNNDVFNCGSCGLSCGSGAMCVGGICLDQNECAQGVVCPPNSTCADVSAGVECRCNFGFEPNMPATECIDVDECSRGFDNCPPSSTCVNFAGGFECRCASGFRKVGGNCVDINECNEGWRCGNGTCVNTVGSVSCSCQFGYTFDAFSRTCVLVDECQAGLLEGYRWCSGGCRDIGFDESHCGGCNRQCATGSRCEDGECECTNAGQTHCGIGVGCVSLSTSQQHCGGCFNACPFGASCVNGECRCPMGQVDCFGECATLGTVERCRSCNDFCPYNGVCTSGGCGCPAELPTNCYDECANLQNDDFNCGACGNYCHVEAGGSCVDGECQCPEELPDRCYESYCFDFETSEEACGNCDTYCQAICNEGACATVRKIALGRGFGCMLFSDGRVGCFGSNDSGRLGRNLATTLTSEPMGLLPLTDIEDIAARDGHACAVDADGDLWCWGENSAQQVGNGNTTDQVAPVMVRGGVAQVAVGLLHTCVVLADGGRVECTGSDALGQRGDGAAAPGFGTWTGPADLDGVDLLVSGANHLCALRDGAVFCWGDNSSGQIGAGTLGTGQLVNAPMGLPSGVLYQSLAAGQAHTCGVSTNFQVACWGESGSYQLGINSTADRVAPTTISGLSSVIEVAAGDAHTCARVAVGGVLCWGSGLDRQNGRTTTSSDRTPITSAFGEWVHIAAGGAHTCGVSQGDFYCWGDGPSITNSFDSAHPVRIRR